MHYQEVTVGSTVLATLEYGADWGTELEAVARAAGIESGWFFGTGAVEDAELVYYDQDEFAPVSVEYDEPLQVPLAMGTISRAAEEPSARTGAVLSRPSGQGLAGVLERATVFGGEVYLQGFEESIPRETDDATDMDLFSV